MPRVACFAAAGIELWFNSNDHRPPHFHVEKPGRWQITVRFLREASEMIVVVWGEGPTASERKVLVRLVEPRRLELLAEWERKVNARDPGPEQ